jgi:hypothetical protein
MVKKKIKKIKKIKKKLKKKKDWNKSGNHSFIGSFTRFQLILL